MYGYLRADSFTQWILSVLLLILRYYTSICVEGLRNPPPPPKKMPSGSWSLSTELNLGPTENKTRVLTMTFKDSI